MAAAAETQHQQQDQHHQRHGVEKQLAKLRRSIEVERNYYEAHQMYRTVVNRYIKQKKYNDALLLLHSGAETLLKHGQSGSGTDLALYFVETLVVSRTLVTGDVREHMEIFLKLIPPTEPGRKRFIQAAVSWSAKHGDYPTGDPQLHHFVGSMYWKEKRFSEAEQHFTLGMESSARLMGRMLYEVAATNASEPNVFGRHLSRGVLRLLAQKKIKYARVTFQSFCDDYNAERSGSVIGTEQFPAGGGAPSADIPQDTDGRNAEPVTVYSDPLVNFCQLLLFAVQRDAADVFNTLKQRYAVLIEGDNEILELVEKVGQAFFNIQPHRPSNVLANLMSSLFAAPDSSHED